MPSDSILPKSDFELFEEIRRGLWFATKQDDYRGAKYLAQDITDTTSEDDQGSEEGEAPTSEAKLAFYDLMYMSNQAPIIAQIFNHENIVSIVGHIQVRPVVSAVSAAQNERLRRPKNYIVWDFCDAGNLSALFQNNPYQTPQYYLPESLCWHVLTSLVWATTYLHDGKRLFFDPEAEFAEPKKCLSMDHDWNPILHRAIEPRNIFFQHPRGIETYGLCKLGNFENAAVTNHIISPGEGLGPSEIEDSFSVALASRRGWRPWNLSRIDMDKAPESFTADDRPYTLADEIWSIGSVIFIMMTGQQPMFYCPQYSCSHITICSRGGCLQDAAAMKGCNCAKGGCQHIPKWGCSHEVYGLQRPRHHECHQPDINVDSHLTRARYSWRLRKTVKDMLDCDPRSKVRITKVLPFAKLVQEHYREWKEGTEEGRAYRDIEDDMMARWEAVRKQEA